jgi:branched-chain amino acid transport system ATP-binding protein/urea transport system ATP-binding protein
VLKLDGVTAGYGSGLVLHGVSFEIGRGETVALVGRNGVGKTTTMRAISGRLPIASGEILLDGSPIAHLPTHRRIRRGVGDVPQGREIFASLSVRENLKLAAYASGVERPAAALEQALADFPVLGEKRHAPGGSLSGGQQQILALARALITRPTALLLDEPTEGIQPSIVAEIADLVNRIQERHELAIVLVEQNLDFAARVAERALIMDRGTIVRELPTRELLASSDEQREYLGI